MEGPHATVKVGMADVWLLGTVPGAVADGARVEAAIAAHGPDLLALGIPPEDLPHLKALVDDPSLADDIEELDGIEAHFVAVLERLGDVVIAPSPDLAAAQRAKLPMSAIDMDDDRHTDMYTASVKVRHLVMRSRAQRRLLANPFEDVADRFVLAEAWDKAMSRIKPLRAIETAREEHMAHGIRLLAADYRRILAVVPAPRLAGVVRQLQG